MENPIKMDDLGVPPFKETPSYIPIPFSCAENHLRYAWMEKIFTTEEVPGDLRDLWRQEDGRFAEAKLQDCYEGTWYLIAYMYPAIWNHHISHL